MPVDSEQLAKLNYDQALKLFNESECLPVPTTREGRKNRTQRSRASLGVDKDWLKGCHDHRGRAVAADMYEKSEEFKKLIEKIRSRNAYMSKKRRPGKPSIENPPLFPEVNEIVHVLTLPDGRRVFPELWKLSFPNLLRVLRERENVSQLDLARMTGLTHPCISFLENGKTSPRIDTLAKVLSHLHLSQSEFDLVCFRLSDACPAKRLQPGTSLGAKDFVHRKTKKRKPRTKRFCRLTTSRRNKTTGDTPNAEREKEGAENDQAGGL